MPFIICSDAKLVTSDCTSDDSDEWEDNNEDNDEEKTFKESTTEANLGNQELFVSRLNKIKKLPNLEKEIFLWREKLAIKKNIPPSFIFFDKSLKEISKITRRKKIEKSSFYEVFKKKSYVEIFMDEMNIWLFFGLSTIWFY